MKRFRSSAQSSGAIAVAHSNDTGVPDTWLARFIAIALLGLVILTLLPYATVETWSITLWEMSLFALTILWAIDCALTGSLFLPRNALLLPLIGLLVLACLQWLAGWTLDSYATRQAIVKLLAYCCFFALACVYWQTDARQRVVARAVIFSCAVIALIGLGQNFLTKFFWQRGAYGPFVNRNHFAGCLVMGVGLASGLLISRTHHKGWLIAYASALLFLLTGVLVSASRGGIGALLAALLFLAVIAALRATRERSHSRQARRGILLQVTGALVLTGAAMVGLVWLAGSETLLDNLAQVEGELKTDPATATNEALRYELYQRRDIWRATWQLIQQHPLLGVGLGAFPLAYARFDPSSGAQRVEQAHNDYLQILADAGALGLLLAVAFLAILFAQGLRLINTRTRQRRAIALGSLAACFAIAIHSVVDFNLQVTANAQLFLALCVLATQPTADHQR